LSPIGFVLLRFEPIGLVIIHRVSFETSFDLKQPKLVSALSKTKHLFRLFCFYTKTEIIDVSIDPKQTEDQPKQFNKEHILVFFSRKFRVFPFVSVCFGLSRFVLVCFEIVCFSCSLYIVVGPWHLFKNIAEH
jgi:hypothetical protein